ncbi:MAG: 16S rRNA (guanine(527)-N(7))-methyltransferase RsmG [Betaproteobacteria bacterium]|nr:16S rRNA (guanine(527)-N(7))-methyltransferase RsmG [Betaproteobacteria bacterium]MBK8108435.1 16S rRNA (guanine(527)-N(7))-methyltransferase RsmG [Betaproteobacteria bacterium]MBK8862886.1 16S rRNA (guanine(527)-N(7))-methyltransferase RsmG [Betaproteobacteria bacterium]
MSLCARVPSELDPICAELGLAPTSAQTSALSNYLDLLQRWNATYNLTAVRDRAGMVTQHLADCLAIIPPLQRRATQGRLLDVGSGGGLPGVVIATLLPGWDVTCVDAVAKKIAFVRQVAGSLGLPNLHAEHSRVESLRALPFELITSRAFASLADFTALTRKHLAPGGAWLAMKGRVPDDEMAALPPDVHVFHVEPLHVPGLNAQRCLVWMQPRKPQ